MSSYYFTSLWFSLHKFRNIPESAVLPTKNETSETAVRNLLSLFSYIIGSQQLVSFYDKSFSLIIKLYTRQKLKFRLQFAITLEFKVNLKLLFFSGNPEY